MASQNFEPINFPNLKEKIKSPLLGALFLSCSFFFTFFFFYFLYTCAHRRHPATADGENHSAPTANAAGLDPSTINSLPVFSYGSIGKKSSAGECAICLGVFQEGDRLKVLPLCHHRFHSDCVDMWLGTRSSCPLCRGGVIQLTP